ncbi:MAG: fused MFS/spermidine synthase [Clostridiales bacterium]|jgi:spermidine synthase|nr:fused MFS/spermidine synthase [Clostridiales bacterium]
MKKQHIILLLSVFICGACTMIIELTGSRILAPFFGTSMYIWASLIGIILGSMALGYYIGGKIADESPSIERYSNIISLGALCIAIMGIIKTPLLAVINMLNMPLIAAGLLSATILFAVPALILAMVSPYAVKLTLTSLDTTGSTMGSLYSMSTFGSIVGTFLAGFVLIPLLGNTIIVGVVSLLLVIIAILLTPKYNLWKKITLSALIILFFFILKPIGLSSVNANIVYEGETEYTSVAIADSEDVRYFKMGVAYESGMYLNGSDELVFDYAKYYDLAEHFNPSMKDAMILGGAGYSYPKYYLNKHPNNTMDVVEIDPKVTKIAQEYFNLDVNNPRLGIIHKDGRSFLNQNTKKYDAIFGDAFKSSTPPYELVTVESHRKILESLDDNGVYIMNLISAAQGKDAKMLEAVYATLREVFPQVFVYLTHPDTPEVKQNVMLVALNSPYAPSLTSTDANFNALLQTLYTGVIAEREPFTDDHSPTEFYSL